MDLKNLKFDIIIQAGQSNAEGCGRGPVTEEYQRDEDILYLEAPFTSRVEVECGVERLIINWSCEPFKITVADERVQDGEKIGNFALTFAKNYKREGLLASDRRLLIIRSGVGGTGFMKKHWVKDGECYQKMIALIDYAVSLNPENRIVGMLWHQGEHDAFEKNSPDIFERQLHELFISVKERYSIQSLPIASADFVNEWKSKNIEDCAPIVEKIKRVVAGLGGEFVETSDLPSNNQAVGNGDDIHFSRESLHILGERYLLAFKRIIDKK